MKVLIEDKDLINLYTKGKAPKLKLPNDVIDKFFATIQKIEAAVDIHDLWKSPGLRFKKMKGFANRYSFRLTSKYRLETEITWLDKAETTGEILIRTISVHYGD